MPTGISQTAANPAALVQRPAAQPREQEPAAAAQTQNAQAALAAGGNDLVRAPEPGPDAQAADNRPENNTAQTEQAPSGGAPTPPERRLQVETDRGLGNNVDVTV